MPTRTAHQSVLKYFPLFLLLIFSGCSFNIEVEYNIRNETGQSITIFVDGPFIDIDTSTISSGTTLIFFEENNGARTATEYLDNLTAVGFDIYIADESGKLFNKDPMDINHWRKIYPERKNGTGRVELRVREDDFE